MGCCTRPAPWLGPIWSIDPAPFPGPGCKSLPDMLEETKEGVRMSGDRQMATKGLRAAGLAVALILATEASGRVPAPMIPTALVEDVKRTTADVALMEYIGTAQVIT